METYKQEGGQFHLFLHHPLVGEDGKPMLDKHGNHRLEQDQRHAQTVDVEGNLVPHSSVEVAFAYCQLPDRIHVFTHGTAEGMKKWVEIHNEHSPHKASLKVFDQSIPPEVVTRAITDHAFFATLL
jgi:hypothetical protein